METVAGALAEQNRLDTTHGELAKAEKYLNRFGIVAFGGLGVAVMFGVGYLFSRIFVKMILEGSTSHMILGILGMLGILCALAALAYVIANEMLKDKRRKIAGVKEGSELSGGVDTGKLLDPAVSQSVSSVTEHSTELLHEKVRTRKLD